MADAQIDPVSNPLGALQAMTLQRAQQNQGYLDQQRARFQQTMGELEEALKAPSIADEAGMWGSMAKGAASVAPQVGNFGQMLAQTGSAYGGFQMQAEQQQLARQQALAKLEEDYLKSLEANQSKLLSGTQRQAPQGFEFRKNSDGTTTAFSKVTGLPMGTYGPQDIGKIAGLTQTLAKAAFERGEYASLDEALNWAQSEAIKRVGQMEGAKGNRTEPLAGDVGGLPTTQPAATQPVTAQPTRLDPSIIAPGKKIPAEIQSAADDVAYDLLREEIATASKAGDRQYVETLQKEMKLRFPTGRPTVTTAPIAPTATPGMIKKDVVKEKMHHAQAEVVGKDIQKEATLLNDAMMASNKMLTQLDLLEKLYSTPNMPEGELADTIQRVRSGLGSLGITVGKEVGAADMARAIASNFALHMRTGEGQNLLPGSISNYEDRLLQQMAPVLSLTQEGRLALARFMKETAKSNARLGHEINLMADERGIISPEWRKRKERIMKEEMARLAVLNRDIMAKFGGTQ